MKGKRWLQFLVSAVSLVLSLGLDLYYPHVKDVLCTALPIKRFGDDGDRYQPDRTSQPQRQEEMIK
jgi:hypothetical protein